MIVWRVSFRTDLLGSEVPGRWNEKGIRVLYTSANPSLCAWEVFAHQISRNEWPVGLNLLKISLPDQHADIIQLPAKDLPIGWNSLPYRREAQAMARTHLLSQNKLGIWVPSAVIAEDFNLILNPNYPDYETLVKREAIFPFQYDDRFGGIFEGEG